MKIKITLLMLFFLVSITAGQNRKTELKTNKEKVGYAIGLSISKNLIMEKENIDTDMVIQGIKDGLDNTSLITDAEINEILQNYQNELMQKNEAERKAAGELNKIAGAKFLAENKTKEGVVTLPSGLQYKVLKTGAGSTPQATDKVRVHYAGKLVDGTEFDSSYKRGEPAEFPVEGVIPGWTEALQLMKVGDKWEVYIPANLAYGEGGAGNVIPPDAVLIFEIELIEIIQDLVEIVQ